nr:thioredoxin family protein [Planctomycetota bacterium]
DDGWVGLGKPRAQVGAHDLRAALDALLAGRKPEVAETAAVGCVITVPASAGTAP